jgi:hypothetical protein
MRRARGRRRSCPAAAIRTSTWSWTISADWGASRSRRRAYRPRTVIQDLIEGQYHNPIGVFGFNPRKGWSRDVSEDVAQEIRRRCDLQDRDLPPELQDFVERHEGQRQLTLRLA